MNKVIASVSNLNIRFSTDRGDLDAVQNISFDIYEQEILAIVGESGSGKSVTSKTLLKLLPDNAISEGKVFLISKMTGELGEINSKTESQIRQIRGTDASMIFQEPATALNPVYKIGWQIAEAIIAHSDKKVTYKELEPKILDILEKVGIPDPKTRINYYPHQFSGGQKQRIIIAQALILGASLIIADEPTTALDVTVQQEILDLLKDVREKFKVSIMLITHNMGVVAQTADRVVVMNKGKIEEIGDTWELFNNPKADYTKKLLSSVPKIDTTTRRANTRKTNIDYNTKILEVKDLTVKFKQGFAKEDFVAVNKSSFTLSKGEVIGIVGESGSGKSTTAKAIVNLVPSTGLIKFYDKDVSKFTKKEKRELMRDIGYIFQDPFASFNPLQTLGQAIAEPMLIVGPKHKSGFGVKSYKDALPRVKELLSLVSLDPQLHSRFPHELSGGQRQRVGIARALALNPSIIIADEPTSALDVTVQKEVLSLFLDLQDKLGFAALFISHDLAVIDMVSDDIIVMNKGEIVEHDTGENILTRPQNEYTKKLISSIPSITPSKR